MVSYSIVVCDLQNHHKASVHNQDVPHIAFDYHTQCKGGNLKNVEKLKQRLIKSLVDFGYFHSREYGVDVIK